MAMTGLQLSLYLSYLSTKLSLYDKDGDVCLSLLRQNSLDGHGWAPTLFYLSYLSFNYLSIATD